MTTSSPMVTLVSECFIKPLHDLSPETKQPIHLTPFELPMLNTNYIQHGLLFTKPENKDFSITAFLDDLKHSLSATLTHFYPLAARLATRKQDNPPSYVIYLDTENNPGVKFIYTKTDATVSDIINPTYVPSIVYSFFDLNNAINHDGHTSPLLSIKVTELTDGIFIGGSINHVVADATSLWHFMASWSEIFKSKDKNGCINISRPPVFKRQALLEGSDPIINLPFTHHDQFTERYINSQVFKERFFSFSSASVARLKKKANAECNTEKISSLQAVSALLWRCVTRARSLTGDSETVCVLAVCNRRRINPPLSNDYFGSPILTAIGTETVQELVMANGLGWAALKLHEVVTNHDNAAVKIRVESWTKNPVIYKLNEMSSAFSNGLVISSSPRLEMYGCEFGLGKAIAVRSGSANKWDGSIRMYPGREGGGSIDVEVCLVPKTMKVFECEEELISALN